MAKDSVIQIKPNIDVKSFSSAISANGPKTNIKIFKPLSLDKYKLKSGEVKTPEDYLKNIGKGIVNDMLSTSAEVVNTIFSINTGVLDNMINMSKTAAEGIVTTIRPYAELATTVKSGLIAKDGLLAAISGPGDAIEKLNKFSLSLEKFSDNLDEKIIDIKNTVDSISPYQVNGKDDIAKLILASDAMSNMFDVFFVFENDGSEGPESLPVKTAIPEIFNKDAITPTILSTRIKSIGIPPIEKATTSIQFCGTSLEKLDNVVNDPHQSSFEILADDSLYYIRLFNKLSGTDFSGLESWNTLANSQLEKLLGEKPKIVTGEMSTLYNSKMDKLFDCTRGKLSIYVKRLYHMPIQSVNKEIIQDAKFNSNLPHGFVYKEGLEENEFPNMLGFQSTAATENNLYSSEGYYMPVFFKFTDVKILGTGGAIGFKREAADTQSFSYDFIYRECFALEGK